MKVDEFIGEVESMGGTVHGRCFQTLVGWSHYEDAVAGHISWLRHLYETPFRGSVLIAQARPGAFEEPAYHLLVLHPSPRDLVEHLLARFSWPQYAPDIAPGVDVGHLPHSAPQDYLWRGRWDDLKGVGNRRIEEDVVIGAGTFVMPGTLGQTTIHKGVRIGHGCIIGHDVRLGEYSLVIAGAKIAGWARIGKRCQIKMGAQIRNGVRIGDGAIIGMGAVVLEDVPPGETWAGNPARRVR